MPDYKKTGANVAGNECLFCTTFSCILKPLEPSAL